MNNHKEQLIFNNETVKSALLKLNNLRYNLTLFVVNRNYKLLGTITDGDIRRGLLNGFTVNDPIDRVMNVNYLKLVKGSFDLKKIIEIKEQSKLSRIKLIPLVSSKGNIENIINFDKIKSILPIEAVIMAGGEGKRLRPLTSKIPKPLLKVGNKPIIEHNVDRLIEFGVQKTHISVKYLGHLIERYFDKVSKKNTRISFVKEESPLGTIGAVSLINNFDSEYILILNSDILTNINYEDFFIKFVDEDADMAVVTIPYKVDIPYAVIETKQNIVSSYKEKPTYTYYSNAGIYLIKKDIAKLIPFNSFFNATDLMDLLIKNGKKIISYPLHSYWLDIGRHDDYEKAQKDINHINF